MTQPSLAFRKYCESAALTCGGSPVRCQCAPPSAVLKMGTPPLPTTSPSEPSALNRTCSGPGPSHVSCWCQVRPPSAVLYMNGGRGVSGPAGALVASFQPTAGATKWSDCQYAP